MREGVPPKGRERRLQGVHLLDSVELVLATAESTACSTPFKSPGVAVLDVPARESDSL